MIVGWDIGGAHLKACLLNQDAQIVNIWQLPCPVWRGLDELHQCMQQVTQELTLHVHNQPLAHAVTMTAELVDLFENRMDGVEQIAQAIAQWIPQAKLYAGKQGFVDISQAHLYASLIASANWMASAQLAAKHYAQVLLVDIGSTTTDFIYVRDGQVQNIGMDDAHRLQEDELLYSGVVRTPLMALTPRIEWMGKQTNVAAEYFATTADVYRLTGELAAHHDLAATADGKDKSMKASFRRLARMVGADVESADTQVWLALAQAFRAAQLQLLQQSLARLVHRHNIPQQLALLGVGAGAFLVKQLAMDSQRDFLSPEQLISTQDQDLLDLAMMCFPAYAVAKLAL